MQPERIFVLSMHNKRQLFRSKEVDIAVERFARVEFKDTRDIFAKKCYNDEHSLATKTDLRFPITRQ